MAEVRTLASEVVGTNVYSTGATGNLVFRSNAAPAQLEMQLEAAFRNRYAHNPHVIVKSAAGWSRIMEANPFRSEAAVAPSSLLLFVVRKPLSDAGLDQLCARAIPPERVARVATGDFYVWFGEKPDGRSKLPAGFGTRALGTVATNRNWNTVTRISALFGSGGIVKAD